MEEFSELDVVSVADSLTSALRERILTQQIRPGDRVAEAAVAQQFRVSRPSARVAVERLIGEGLLERSAHRAARVLTFRPEAIVDMYLSRAVIETGAYRMLAETAHDYDKAEREITRLHAAATSGDVVELVDADVRFHRELVDLLGSPGLSSTHDKLINQMRLCLAQVQSNHLLDPFAIEQEHRSILEALRASDADTAGARGRQHLERARDILLAHLTCVTTDSP
ncbi:GntR family transcriptional regulator [Saccharopolyspora hattusasensis]|uniref:GntR family transcriptional regulator n=1 Tax=Saccharopolyspora hattusasensis TaxID=1128679 RepID=UPI003D99E7EE